VSDSVPDPSRLREEVTERRFRSTVLDHIRQAAASGVRGVPEVFIDGRHYDGALTPEQFTAALEGREWRAGWRGPGR
jgi:predicted DsbA family dithiol-disulfide isomerase